MEDAIYDKMGRWRLCLGIILLIGSQAFAQIVVRAVVDGDTDCVRQEIGSGVDVNMMHPTTGWSLLATDAGRRHVEIAEAASVSRETIRSQLKRLYAKTGVSGQADLVRLVHDPIYRPG